MIMIGVFTEHSLTTNKLKNTCSPKIKYQEKFPNILDLVKNYPNFSQLTLGILKITNPTQFVLKECYGCRQGNIAIAHIV